ncbi:MAG: S-adenosylmethionine decarboxylase [Patescibacteria group bacterium]
MNILSKAFPTEGGQTTFGLHLMLDAYGVDPSKLSDMKLIFKYLNDLPKIIDMKKLTTPYVVDCDATESGKDPGGISGFVMIAESHISIHTFAKRGFFTMDCYSCNNFEEEVEELLAYTKQIFPYTDSELQVVKRGLKYPVENV